MIYWLDAQETRALKIRAVVDACLGPSIDEDVARSTDVGYVGKSASVRFGETIAYATRRKDGDRYQVAGKPRASCHGCKSTLIAEARQTVKVLRKFQISDGEAESPLAILATNAVRNADLRRALELIEESRVICEGAPAAGTNLEVVR